MKKKFIEFFVIIGIIVLWWGIAYFYFSSNIKQSQNTQRIADIIVIGDSLNTYFEKNSTFPLPINSVVIYWEKTPLIYQWDVPEEFLLKAWIFSHSSNNGNKALEYFSKYTYSIDASKKTYNLMAFLDSQSHTWFQLPFNKIPYNYRNHPQGNLYQNRWGIILEEKLLRPIHYTQTGMDITKTIKPYIFYVWEKNILKGNYQILKHYLSFDEKLTQSSSCKELKSAWFETNQEYYLEYFSLQNAIPIRNTIKVFCDMESGGGWRTRLFYKKWPKTCFSNKIPYKKEFIENVFTKDFGVSDSLFSLKSEYSWILEDIFQTTLKNDPHFFEKFTLVSNCLTPTGTPWSNEYGKEYVESQTGRVLIYGTLKTLGWWSEMFYGCERYVKPWEKISFTIGGSKNHEWQFIHGACNNYQSKDYSITSLWDWDNTRVFWVR